jgi:hypothetical protein
MNYRLKRTTSHLFQQLLPGAYFAAKAQWKAAVPIRPENSIVEEKDVRKR